MRESDTELIPIRAERVITKVAIQVHERTRSKAQVTPTFVVSHIGHDVAGRQHANLLFRIHR